MPNLGQGENTSLKFIAEEDLLHGVSAVPVKSILTEKM